MKSLLYRVFRYFGWANVTADAVGNPIGLFVKQIDSIDIEPLRLGVPDENPCDHPKHLPYPSRRDPDHVSEIELVFIKGITE